MKAMSAAPQTVPEGGATEGESTGGESITFEQALDELDVLVRRMESGQLSLDESIAAYRRGAELARFCQTRLANAEQEIKRLEGDLLKPLDIATLKIHTDKADTE